MRFVNHGGHSCVDEERERNRYGAPTSAREPLPGQQFKELPRGCLWVFFRSLGPKVTDADVEAFLRERGLDIPLDHIAVNPRRDGLTSAQVAIPDSQILYMLNYYIDGQMLGNAPMIAHLPDRTR